MLCKDRKFISIGLYKVSNMDLGISLKSSILSLTSSNKIYLHIIAKARSYQKEMDLQKHYKKCYKNTFQL